MSVTSDIAIIAGSGAFPFEIAHAVEATGHRPFILGLRGFIERGPALRRFDHEIADMLDPQSILSILHEHQIKRVILAGGVSRPGPLALLSIYSFFRNREELKRIVSGGDDRILRGVIRLLEDNGFSVIGIDEAAPDLLIKKGQAGSLDCPEHLKSDIDLALSCLALMGEYDMGQGAVVARGRILALEGPEGTDAMLERVRAMQKNRRVVLDNISALLVKAAKPGQDRRVDLPAIGPQTIKMAKSAGLSGIAVVADEVVMVERQRLIDAANHSGIFIWGAERS